MCSRWWVRFLLSAFLSLSFSVSTRAIAFEDVTIDKWLKTNSIAPPTSDADLPQLFERYADHDGWAAYYLGKFYLTGANVKPDWTRGIHFLTKAASLGNGLAAADLGYLLLQEHQQLASIDAKYPGWEDTVRTKEFADWLAKQPAERRALADSNKAEDAIKLLDAYEEQFDEQARKRRRIEAERRRKEQGATDEAIRWLSRAVELGNSWGMYWLASTRIDSSDPEEVKSAIELLTRADKAGNNAATFSLSVLYAEGKIVPRDPPVAFQFARKAALSEGNISTSMRQRIMARGAYAPLAGLQLASYYRDGFGTSPDPLLAIEWYERAAALDDQNSQGWYERHGVRGNLVAMRHLGYIYLKGGDVAQDYGKALRWYTAASERGDVISTSMLAYMYREGLGVPKNPKRAVALLEQAASQDEMLALTDLGILLAEGAEGVRQDKRRAVEYLTKAASRGHVIAISKLIDLKAADSSLPVDIRSHVLAPLESLAKDPANEGAGYASYLLGETYFKGVVITRDIAQAEKWLTRAASLGLDLASYDLGRLLEEKGDLSGALKAYVTAAENRLPSGYVRAASLFLDERLGQVDLMRAEEYLNLAYRKKPELYESIAWAVSQTAFQSREHFALAIKWLEIAASHEHPRALSVIGFMKLEGSGLPKDVASGKALVLRAYEKKDSFAAGIIGSYNLHAPGFFPLQVDAVELLQQSVSSYSPFPLAIGNMGRLYIEGSRVPQDISRGVNLLRVAAEHGDASAMATLSDEYLRGRILPRDLAQAKIWAELSKKYYLAEADTLIKRVEDEIRWEREQRERELAEQARIKRVAAERRAREAAERARRRAQVGEQLNQGLKKLGSFLVSAAEVGLLVGIFVGMGALVAAGGPAAAFALAEVASAPPSIPSQTITAPRYIGNPSYAHGITSYGEREIEIRPRYNPDPTQRYRGTIDRHGDFTARNLYQYLETGQFATMRGNIDRFGYGRAVDSLGNQYQIRR